MKVYIVITERGTIYSVSKSKKIAEKDKEHLENLYECYPMIQEFTVQ
jgi:hypothetical protein